MRVSVYSRERFVEETDVEVVSTWRALVWPERPDGDGWKTGVVYAVARDGVCYRVAAHWEDAPGGEVLLGRTALPVEGS
jgi:hypothetical protein